MHTRTQSTTPTTSLQIVLFGPPHTDPQITGNQMEHRQLTTWNTRRISTKPTPILFEYTVHLNPDTPKTDSTVSTTWTSRIHGHHHHHFQQTRDHHQQTISLGSRVTNPPLLGFVTGPRGFFPGPPVMEPIKASLLVNVIL